MFGLSAITQTSPSADVAFMLVSMALVQLMTPGLGFFYAGLCRPSGATTMMAYSITAMGVLTILWITIGFGLSFGPQWDPANILGQPFSYPFFEGVSSFKPLKMPNSDDAYGFEDLPGWLFALYQNKFAVISPALASGAIADRINLNAWMIFICLWMLLIYAPWCRAIWGGGYYAQQGVADFAGGIVVHTTSGWTALVVAKFLGPRRVQEERPHSTPLVVLGTALLWFGWFGFNAGSAYAANGVAITAAVNSQVAASAAMVGWGVLHYQSTGKLGLIPLCVGAIAGLATITPGAGFVQPYMAVIYGLLASLICFNCIKVCRQILKVDDALDVWAVHGVGGGLGTILIGFLADGPKCLKTETAPTACVNPGVVAHGMETVLKQTEAVVVCIIYSTAVAYLIMLFLSLVMDISPKSEFLDEEILDEQTYDLFEGKHVAPSVSPAPPAPVEAPLLEPQTRSLKAPEKGKVRSSFWPCCRQFESGLSKYDVFASNQ